MHIFEEGDERGNFLFVFTGNLFPRRPYSFRVSCLSALLGAFGCCLGAQRLILGLLRRLHLPTFDGETLRFLERGSAHTVPIGRGMHEPSLALHRGRYYLTIRNDERGYVACSDDGLYYSEPQPWTFDDGQDLGNYNTQQHWVTHRDGLFLVYTRRGAQNDHVFRHRAPLFIAQVDPERLAVVRETERVLVPERGARLGNFGVVAVTPEETWVTVCEWMQPARCERYGSDNTLWVARIRWGSPNTPEAP